ncbi:hypothetical protein PMAYCL1PPCAC_17272, partial [Pristionchus mayeri]
ESARIPMVKVTEVNAIRPRLTETLTLFFSLPKNSPRRIRNPKPNVGMRMRRTQNVGRRDMRKSKYIL